MSTVNVNQDSAKEVQEVSQKQELADGELNTVSGGFNPQPEPLGRTKIDPLIFVRKAGKDQQDY